MSAIDRAALDQLGDSIGNDPEFLRELVDAYLDDAPKQLAAIREGISRSDMALFHRAAHTLKSSSISLGALRLAEACRELEVAAGSAATNNRALDASWLGTRVDDLTAELDRVRQDLDSLVPQVAG